MTPPEWLDVEALVVARLSADLDGYADVATDTPNDLQGRRFVRVQAVAGSDDGLTDSALLDVEAFGPTREAAADLAARTRRHMHNLAATADADGRRLIDRVSTGTRPQWTDYRNPAVQRFVATYWVTHRLQ